MNRRKNTAYGLDELLSLIKKTFGEQYNGEYAIITSVKKADDCLYGLYANPVTTTSLVYNPHIRDGFKFEVQSTRQEQAVFDTPEDAADLLLAINSPEFKTTRVYRKTGQPAAAVMGNTIAVKIQDGFPTPEEINNAFKPLKTKAKYVTVLEDRITQSIREAGEKAISRVKEEEKLLARIRNRFSRTSQST